MFTLFILGHSLEDSAKIPLLAELNKRMPAAAGLSPDALDLRLFYLLHMQRELTSLEQSRLSALLGTQMTSEPKEQCLYVLPRKGTRSPWSSKAGSILNDTLEKEIVPLHIEKGTSYHAQWNEGFTWSDALERKKMREVLHDEMIEGILKKKDLNRYFESSQKAAPLLRLDRNDRELLKRINAEQGFALNEKELEYLANLFTQLGRDATDAELAVFSQLNSEHCRHKVFGAQLEIDGKKVASLFSRIKNTSAQAPEGIVSAYTDNAALFDERVSEYFHAPMPEEGALPAYVFGKRKTHLIFKAETHNHPTFVSPYPGAATGVGGEIRDELACGRGGRTKAGFSGFSVSSLNIDGFNLSRELHFKTPLHKADGKHIMRDGPLGSNNYGNEFGRPNLCGYFRSFSFESQGIKYGYHKPIMLAGGWGEIDAEQADKSHLEGRDKDEPLCIVLLGEPALRIGIGGGSVSSLDAGESGLLDFASVQRDNAEMERRCAEVIIHCSELGEKNPIRFIHDLGAGGVGNAIAELLKDNNCGALIDLSSIPIGDMSLSAREILTNESQERFLMTVPERKIEHFARICKRENAPYAVIGKTNDSGKMQVHTTNEGYAVDMEIDAFFPDMRTPLIVKQKESTPLRKNDHTLPEDNMLAQYAKDVLTQPTVGSKSFLITIADRSVGGLTTREQMIGPYQMPVSDYAATLANYRDCTGEVFALGERTPIAVFNAAHSVSMALAELVSNLAASGISRLQDIKLCANWMAAVDEEGELYALHKAVKHLADDLCCELGLAIPVGKDSLFMRTSSEHKVVSPVSLILSGLAPIEDLRKGRTPQMLPGGGRLWWFAPKKADAVRCLGGSVLGSLLSLEQEDVPSASAKEIQGFFNTIALSVNKGYINAYHDVSDGGVWTSLCEMAFASNCGLDLDFTPWRNENIYRLLFSEELGALAQVTEDKEEAVKKIAEANRIECIPLGEIHPQGDSIVIRRAGKEVINEPMTRLRQAWGEVSYQMSHRRDYPPCAKQEYAGYGEFNKSQLRHQSPGKESAAWSPDLRARKIAALKSAKPKMAILRCPGTNGQREMAAAFDTAGFCSVDVPLTDIHKNFSFKEFKGMVFCGGFSYGDALGAGAGWAARIMEDTMLRDAFAYFFERKDSFTLGVCNGCQVLSRMQDIIPGADWNVNFLNNQSGRYEGRTVMVKIRKSPSIFFQGMEGCLIPIATAHAQGKATFTENTPPADDLIVFQYADEEGKETNVYPLNPNGSEQAIAGLTSKDGRVTIMMPHPERMQRDLTENWRHPTDYNLSQKGAGDGVWQNIFYNARLWLE